MSEFDARDDDALPNELPPVQPPSAGFILQLFLIPALIIGVIVGVVFVFGWIASSSGEDWRKLAQDIGSPNEHIRWRAAVGLAQMLPLDEKRAESGEQLVSNRQLAEALCSLLEQELQRAAPDEKQVQFQAYLTRTIQLLRVPDLVVPALLKSTENDQDLEVRKSGLAAIAVFANRAQEAGQPLTSEFANPLVERLIEVSQETSPPADAPLMRQMAAYALGLFPTESATRQLQALLGDGNPATRANAMIALARNHDLSGLPVLEEILRSAANPPEPDDDAFLQFASVKNSILAVENLAPQLTAEQRTQLLELLQPIADGHAEARIRIDAGNAMQTLKSADDNSR